MRFRLMNIPANELSNVLKENNVNYNNISPALFKELHAKLQRVMNARWNNNNITITAADFYEVSSGGKGKSSGEKREMESRKHGTNVCCKNQNMMYLAVVC